LIWAIGIGDDAFLDVRLEHVRIHFRHDERHVAIHAPLRGVVDDDGALFDNPGRPFLRDERACGHQHDVGALEVVMLQRLHLEDRIAERDFRAGRAGGGERNHVAGGKLALGQDGQHLATHIAGRADDGDFV
jgi:hypothetical protein